MPIEVGGKSINKKVYVFQVILLYNLLLGRPWIYKLRVLTSTLHRLIKFMYKDKKVKIHTEVNAMDLFQENQIF